MAIAALITWLVTALLGFVMLGRWAAGGGLRAREGTTTRLPVPVALGHFLLAATGLVIWIAFLITDAEALPWVAVVLLVLVAGGGLVMFLRWWGVRDADAVESSFPQPVVYGHGLFAVTTAVLVLLTALGVGVD